MLGRLKPLHLVVHVKHVLRNLNVPAAVLLPKFCKFVKALIRTIRLGRHLHRKLLDVCTRLYVGVQVLQKISHARLAIAGKLSL